MKIEEKEIQTEEKDEEDDFTDYSSSESEDELVKSIK